MVGMGMIFEETYRPCFEQLFRNGLHDRSYGELDVRLAGVATRTGARAARYLAAAGADRIGSFENIHGDAAVSRMLQTVRPDFVCVATPDDRHFDAALSAIESGADVLIEKPAVLSLDQLDNLNEAARSNRVLARVIYHKLFDPDHKKLRTLVRQQALKHVNHGYCSLFEPKQISGSQFSEWISGRNPGTYVAVHYIKLIDFTFGGTLKTVSATGQRGIVGSPDSTTWDSCQLRLIYEYDDQREAAFDIHTSWVHPDNFPGWVEQEVQFRFDNGVWNGHSRKRGVECTIAGRTPHEIKTTLNNHYNGSFVEPWNQASQKGYGIEAVERFIHEVACVRHGGSEAATDARLEEMRSLDYSDLSADRQVVAAIQALESILSCQAAGRPDCVVRVNDARGGLVLYDPSERDPEVLYAPPV